MGQWHGWRVSIGGQHVGAVRDIPWGGGMRMGSVCDDESKLGTCMPAFWGTFWVSIIRVDRYSVIPGCIRVAKREKEYMPEWFMPGVSPCYK